MGAIVWQGVVSVVVGYLLGSIPIGLLLVRLSTGKDLRQEHSGRTGGTNAARAAGLWAGVGTGLGDGLKAACAVWLAHALTGANPWVEAAAGIAAVLGHNYSLFLLERRDGKIHLRGGAGGAPTIGAVIALSSPAALVLLPTMAAALFLVGYASVATISVGTAATVFFLVRAAVGRGPWAYVVFGVVDTLLLLLALRPNLQRLRQGTERVVGLRAWLRKRAEAAGSQGGEPPRPPAS